ncbi:hypothetical protein [Deinococcus soli (ex Cha et al. 2016)]|uniref:Uncharacterized protein n=2 Tax=Deinococcus soli (ex Cha et al. 2016) TaxID=1309411 RepID=A0ACC6KEJ3_9DEIO|nr:hypothetical protein [Deinococcus soli (ex Cha et al. 2016)]MDR6217798.1 hypothetical protein [Deinococcus soli (ex Cha et al. 2016)]MDR6328048.1 hypothetical protein [Deinococcus soli (ex Cha et al. 2016)]MDR6750900.1 hypothetical protein [Deinococcus soli (ex Cha et al. 2016)]
MRRLHALLLLASLGAQARSDVPLEWAALASRFPGFAGAAVDVHAGRPRLTLLWTGPGQPPVRALTDALGEEAREAARTGVTQVRPAPFTLVRLLDAQRTLNGAGRLDPLLNRVVVSPGSAAVSPAGITVTAGEVARDSRLSVFVRPTSPARGVLAADVRVVNTGRWPVRVDWNCVVVRLRVLDVRGRDVTVLRDDEACAGSPPVILWPGEVRRADPVLPVLDGLPGGRYRLRAELDVAGLRAAHEATLDWQP